MLINKVFRQCVSADDKKTRIALGLIHDWKASDVEASERTESELIAEGYVPAVHQLPSRKRSAWIFIDHESHTYVIPPPIHRMPMPRGKIYGHVPVQIGCEMRLLSLGGVPEGYALCKDLEHEIFMVARYFIVNEDLREYKTIPNGVDSRPHVMPVWPRFDSWIGKPGRCYIDNERPGSGFTCLDDPTHKQFAIINDQRREYTISNPSMGNLALPYRWTACHYVCSQISGSEWSAPNGYTEVAPSLLDGSADSGPRVRFLVNHTHREYVEMPDRDDDGIFKFVMPIGSPTATKSSHAASVPEDTRRSMPESKCSL
jgi:hypothetical protein